MQENFERSLRLIAGSEGGYSNHPADPGGATMRGVTLRNYQAYCKRKGKPRPGIAELRAISEAEVAEIFRLDYWNRVRGDVLPAGVDYAAADYAFNSGASQASKDLQRTIAALGGEPGPLDATIGSRTLAALDATLRLVGAARFINAYCDRRWSFMQKLKNFPSFERGWKRRIAEVRANGLKMASGAALVPPTPTPTPTPATRPAEKANPGDARQSTIPGVKSTATAVAGAVAAAATAAAERVLDAASYQGAGALIYGVLAFLVLSAIGGFLAYRFARNKPAEDGAL